MIVICIKKDHPSWSVDNGLEVTGECIGFIRRILQWSRQDWDQVRTEEVEK